MTEPIDTHHLIIPFGRWNGTPYTQVPVDYLKWMVNHQTQDHEIAAAELERRGTVTPNLEVSGHAIDRASLKCRRIWYDTSKKEEGLHAWLVRMTEEALERGRKDDKGRYCYNGMVLIITDETTWPVLKTVHPKRDRQGHRTHTRRSRRAKPTIEA